MDWPLIFTLALSIAMVTAIVLDTTRYIIPNTLNLAVLGLYPFAAFILGLDWAMALIPALIVLTVGLGIFALGLMGGGDVKLIAVLTLWCGWSAATPQFLMLTTIFGGALVILVLLLRWILPPLWPVARPLPRLLTAKQPVPYGIAVAAAFLMILWGDQVPGLTH